MTMRETDATARPRLVMVLSQWPWPATSGGRVRTKFLAEALSAWYDVTVLSGDHADGRFAEWDAAARAAEKRRASKWRRAADAVAAVILGRQVLLRRYERVGMPAACASVLERLRPDVCVLGRPMFGRFIEVARAAGAKIVIEADEDLVRVGTSIALSRAPLSRRLVAAVDAMVVGRQQATEYPRADVVIAGSRIERGRLARYADAGRTVIVPNVVDAKVRAHVDVPVRALAFVGAYGYAPNEAAALELIDEIFPAVLRLGGPPRLILVGRDPTRAMLRRARSRSNVEITGEVEDVAEPLREAGVLVVPLRAGAGTRVKIIEAAMLGTPVVSTPFGVEGLPLEDKRHVLLADKPEQFARAVIALREDRALRRRLVTNAASVIDASHGRAAGESAVAALVSIVRTSGNDARSIALQHAASDAEGAL